MYIYIYIYISFTYTDPLFETLSDPMSDPLSDPLLGPPRGGGTDRGLGSDNLHFRHVSVACQDGQRSASVANDSKSETMTKGHNVF